MKLLRILLLAILGTATVTARPISLPADAETSPVRQVSVSDLEYLKRYLPRSSEDWIVAFSRSPWREVIQSELLEAALSIYLITENKAPDILKIDRNEELTWLIMYGIVIVENRKYDDPSDEAARQELAHTFGNFIESRTDSRLLDMINFAIENNDSLRCSWLERKIVAPRYEMNAYNSFMCRIVYRTLDVLTSRGMDPADAVSLALKATFKGYDPTQPPMEYLAANPDYRAVDIMLRWGDKPAVIKLIKRIFNPGDAKNVLNNLRIVETLMNYAQESAAAELVLIGNDTTPSILLSQAITEYAKADYDEQKELCTLINKLQKYIFN